MTKKNQKSCTNMLKIFQYPSLFLCSLSAQSPSQCWKPPSVGSSQHGGRHHYTRNTCHTFLLTPKKSFLFLFSMFSVRVVRHWNRLPTDVVDAPCLVTFKAKLHQALCNLFELCMFPVIAGELDYMTFKGPFQLYGFYDFMNKT